MCPPNRGQIKVMISMLFSILITVHAGSLEKLPRAGITLASPTGSWKKMKSLPVLELQDFDLLLENVKESTNRRFVSTQFGSTLDICQSEIESLKKAGFKLLTTSKKEWACILRAEKGTDRRYTAVREINRSAGKRPSLISQVILIEVGAGNFDEFEKWLSTVKAIK